MEIPMSVDRRTLLQTGAGLALASAFPALAQQSMPVVPVTVDTREPTGALPHIWEECVGSDRAAITLRESWRQDLDRWRLEAGLKRVRFHGIFNDELGVYAPSILSLGKPASPNFQNVDRVYDGLHARGVAPFIELSFMPKALASADRTFGFYAANISPPSSPEAWASFIKSFVVHLVDRYGLATVREWPFEVWNEPNLGFFWTGDQKQYFDLYKATSVAIKSVDSSLQVGGPSTSAVQWLSEFATYCSENNAPVDFISTHVYAGDQQKKVFGDDRKLPQADVIPAGISQARQQIDATALRGRPLWLTEWFSDSPAMIAHIVAGCLPHCRGMSHWTLSQTYEELGVASYLLKEGYMGFGSMVQGIALPIFNTYKLLHVLGTQRLSAEGPVLASRRADKTVAALVWNLADVAQPGGIPGAISTRTVSGEPKRFEIAFAGARAGQKVRVSFVDQERGSPMPAWREMGSPQYIKPDQIRLLRQRAEIPAPTTMRLDASRKLALDLPAEGVALIEFI
jgi:xylan 1,4-beta-xylosidase